MEHLKIIEKLIPADIELGLSIIDTDGNYYGMNDHIQFPLASLSKLIASVIALSLNINVEDKLIHKAISEHCNDSFQAILKHCDTRKINQKLQELGLHLMIDTDNTSREHNCGDSKSLAEFMRMIVVETLLNPEQTQLIIHALQAQTDPDGFQLHRFPDITWAHMTGGLSDICNDMGYFLHQGKPLICVGLVKAQNQIEWVQLENTLSQVGEIINELYNG